MRHCEFDIRILSRWVLEAKDNGASFVQFELEGNNLVIRPIGGTARATVGVIQASFKDDDLKTEDWACL